MDLKQRIADELEGARRRSLDLLDPVDDHDLVVQHSPLMSPLVWDLAHVGNYEEQWLLGAVTGERTAAHLDDLYDAFRHPRQERPTLPMLGPSDTRTYIAEVRGRVLDALDRVALDASVPLLDGGFVYGMVAQHEHQHDETMLATLQLRAREYPTEYAMGEAGRTTPPPPLEVLIAPGPFVMGTSIDPWAYDNEQPAHTVDLPGFWIDTAPVSNHNYAQFVEDGGYDDQRWWCDRGFAWRRETGTEHPQFWRREGSSWSVERFGRQRDLCPDEPVQHVCWFEADAYARWAGRRLPTEAEWEKAAAWGPDDRRRRFPWGDDDSSATRANLGQSRFGPAPIGSYPDGVSAYGVHQLIGDVWEWTSSGLEAYPGFKTFPYREYSEVFFGGDYKVLRGGSWATHPTAIRSSFRNWDHPMRRQIFAGFRCARDAG